MKPVFALIALAALALPTVAGGAKCSSTEYRCENECPLAKQANARRSFGTESLAASKIARAEHSDAVVRNLARI